MYWGYLVVPFLAWLVAGGAKFVDNSLCSGQFAFSQIGYGGFPSNHSAIVSSVAALVAFNEGVSEPAFGVALAVCFIVILDATSLRQKIGDHAVRLNRLTNPSNEKPLRERVGHTPFEVFGGCVVAYSVSLLTNIV